MEILYSSKPLPFTLGQLPFLKRKCDFKGQSQKCRSGVESCRELWIRGLHPGAEMNAAHDASAAPAGGRTGNMCLDNLWNYYGLMATMYVSFFWSLKRLSIVVILSVSTLYTLCLYVSFCVLGQEREFFYVCSSLGQCSSAQEASCTYGPYSGNKIQNFDLDVMMS